MHPLPPVNRHGSPEPPIYLRLQKRVRRNRLWYISDTNVGRFRLPGEPWSRRSDYRNWWKMGGDGQTLHSGDSRPNIAVTACWGLEMLGVNAVDILVVQVETPIPDLSSVGKFETPLPRWREIDPLTTRVGNLLPSLFHWRHRIVEPRHIRQYDPLVRLLSAPLVG